jgi:hypothetical protein
LREAALAEQWNGSTWKILSIPQPANAGSTLNLNSVSCTSATSCTAVGGYLEPGAGPAEQWLTLAEHWNGSTWTIQSTPTPAGVAFTSLFGVSCTSATNCTAVGDYTTGITSGPGATLIEQWNGSTWTTQASPNPSGAGLSLLGGVWCASATSCTAVGFSMSSSTFNNQTLAEQWNGSTWTIQPTPDPSGALDSGLSGLWCASASNCTAVGGYSASPGVGQTLAEQWNGSTWAIQPTPALAGPADSETGLNGVWCASAARCTAVGSSGLGALVELWNGSTWRRQSAAQPAKHQVLSGLSCTSAGTCTAVGAAATGPLAERE